MTTVLVTGGLGFIGMHAAAALAARGERAVILDTACRSSQGELRGEGWGNATRDPAEPPAWLPPAAREILWPHRDRLVFLRGDVRSLPELLCAIRDHEVDSIVHAAAIFDPVLSVENPYESFDVNVQGAVCVFEAARLAGIRRVVHLSTIAVITEREYEPIDEAHPLFSIKAGNPSGPHGSVKAAAEVLGMTYASTYGLDWIGLRHSAVFGYGMRASVHIRPMVELSVQGRPCIFAKGHMARDYLYVDDAIDGILRALDVPADRLTQRVFNIAAGEITTTEELAGLVKAVIPSADIRIGGGMSELEASNLKMRGRLEICAARGQLDWAPRFDLKSGIEAFAQRLRDDGAG